MNHIERLRKILDIQAAIDREHDRIMAMHKGIVDLYVDLAAQVERCKAAIRAAEDQRDELRRQTAELCEGEKWQLGLENEWQPDPSDE